MFLSAKRNYRRSNQILAVDFWPSAEAVNLAGQLLATMETTERQRLSSALLDELSDAAEIAVANVTVSDTQQYHKRRGNHVVFKQYGYYRPQSSYIYIQNRTAVRGQLLAAKTFLDTLLHEWTHHYDYQRLKLNSIHTAGFYQRLASLKARL